MVARKLPKEVQRIFDKYVQNNVRRLKKDEAVEMLKTEFNMTEEQSASMFDAFDQDKNGIMSIWEFQQFYQCVGNNAAEMVKKFEEMDADGSGKLDADEARAGLKSLQMTGRGLEDREIEFFLKSSIGDDNMIDLGHFAGMLFKLKVYEGKRKPKK